jgi:hypothetical protein
MICIICCVFTPDKMKRRRRGQEIGYGVSNACFCIFYAIEWDDDDDDVGDTKGMRHFLFTPVVHVQDGPHRRKDCTGQEKGQVLEGIVRLARLHIHSGRQFSGRRSVTAVPVRVPTHLELYNITLFVGEHEIAKVGGDHFRFGFEFHALVHVHIIGIVITIKGVPAIFLIATIAIALALIQVGVVPKIVRFARLTDLVHVKSIVPSGQGGGQSGNVTAPLLQHLGRVHVACVVVPTPFVGEQPQAQPAFDHWFSIVVQ